MSQNGSRKGGEELELFELFLARAPLGPQGLLMELPGDSEDQFFKILARFGTEFAVSLMLSVRFVCQIS